MEHRSPTTTPSAPSIIILDGPPYRDGIPVKESLIRAGIGLFHDRFDQKIASTKKLPLRGQRRLEKVIPDFPFNFTKQISTGEHHKLSGADFSA